MRHFTRILAPLVLVLTLLFAMIPLPVSAQTLYENLSTGDNATQETYGANWSAQTFTTGSAHTVSSVSLKLNSTGTPDIFTVGIRLTTLGGDPMGGDLCAGTYNGSNCTNSSSGAWYSINITPEYSLEDNTTYAIVTRAVAGDSGNNVGWFYNSTDDYADGNFTTSANSGATWISSAGDFMFKVYGSGAMALGNTSVFSSMVEDGDWLVVFLYKNIYPPYYQYENPQAYFNLQFLNTTGTIVAQNKMPAWGYKPGCVYLSHNTALNLSWGSNCTMKMNGTTAKFGNTTPSVSHTLLETEYIGSETWWLGEWIISSAHVLESYYDINLTMDSLGNETFPYTILNEVGCNIYITGIPGIEELCPERFWTVKWQPQYSETNYTNAYQNTLNWVNQTSTIGSAGQIPSTLNETAALFNLSGSNIGLLMVFIVFVAVVGTIVYTTGSVPGAVALGGLVLVAGGWLGFVPLAVLLIGAALAVMSVIWIIYLRGT